MQKSQNLWKKMIAFVIKFLTKAFSITGAVEALIVNELIIFHGIPTPFYIMNYGICFLGC